jgi:hypothetical protein
MKKFVGKTNIHDGHYLMLSKLFYIPLKPPFFGHGHKKLPQHQCRIKPRVGAFSKYEA